MDQRKKSLRYNYVNLYKVKLFKNHKIFTFKKKNEFNKYKYINTVNEINENKQNGKLNINSSNVVLVKK